MRTEKYAFKLRHGRGGTAAYTVSMVSVARLHMETLNIWTHCLGAICLSASAAQLVFALAGSAAGTVDTAAVVVYLAAAAICFLCSSRYHTFANHASARAWQRIDHLGIVAVIWGSSVSFAFFAFFGFFSIVRLLRLLHLPLPAKPAKDTHELSDADGRLVSETSVEDRA